ncbi:class II glutamine amidotransferase [Vibrio hippocampi]|uniref:Glutamine amidotransferase YafJ n=1 Tax=Vibrio hippocampi TaxID=654686 RepID=A0ABN8DH57_9VIBR|nr:class II glutamine amidotransferase [Vibrio hippocampi]CAH0524972.1 Putative glutamine amidotransferase YafJ [Vibrio hippocampi]
MCELLGMSANVPTDICFSFTGLIQRGGNTGPHKDGWGITFYEGKGFRTFKDPNPSCDSEIAELVQKYPIKSRSVVSHIRQANRGKVNLENTHPFTRELWGRYWTLAHNGQLSDYHSLETGRFRPVGQTDSELSFCWLLNKLEQKFPEPPTDMLAMFQYVATCCDELHDMGVYNMLLSDGEYVMTYCTNHLYWITRRAPFGKATLLDEDVTINFQEETTSNDVVSVIATQPLTGNESWSRMKPREFNLFHHGDLVLSNVEQLKDVAFAAAKPGNQAPTEKL